MILIRLFRPRVRVSVIAAAAFPRKPGTGEEGLGKENCREEGCRQYTMYYAGMEIAAAAASDGWLAAISEFTTI